MNRSVPDRSASERSAPRTGAGAGWLAAGGLLLIVFLALGIWQLQRRIWKLDLIERVNQRVSAPAVPLPPPAQWAGMRAADAEYLAVEFSGHWLGDKTVLTQAVTVLGAGYWVLTPLQRDDGSQILVNRGFIAQDQRARWTFAQTLAADTALVRVEGLLRMSEPGGGFLRRNDPEHELWYSRDVQAIAQAAGLAHCAPFFVDAGRPDPRLAVTGASADLDGDAPAERVGHGAEPRAGLTVIRFPNSHLVYALTWFGLALLLAAALWYVSRSAPGRDTPDSGD